MENRGRFVLEVFGDESWVGNLSRYGGYHQRPGYLQRIIIVVAILKVTCFARMANMLMI